MAGPTVRTATTDDIAAMAAIYGREATQGHATFDVEPRPHEAWLPYVASTAPGDVALVATDAADGRVLGYATASAYRPKPAYEHTREATVYVDPDARGRGAGRALYAELLARLRAAEVHVVVAVVALPNDASTALHSSLGFTPVGTLREVGRKHGRWIDVELHQLLLQ